MIFLLMAVAKRDNISKIKITKLNEYCKGLLKLILQLFGVKFKIEKVEIDDYEEDENDDEELSDNKENDSENEDNFEDDEDDKEKNDDKVETPNFYLIFSCVGYQMDNKNRVEN